MPETDSAIHAAIKAAIPDVLPRSPGVVSIEPVRRPEANHPGVWVVTTDGGLRVVAKHQIFAPLTRGEPYDLLEVEDCVGRMLRDVGCPVPHVYGVDSAHSLIFSQWCGEATLDDVCQESDESERKVWGTRAVEGFCTIQRVLGDRTPKLASRVFPGCDREGLLESWNETVQGLGRQVGDLVVCLNPGASPQTLGRVETLWRGLVDTLADAPSILGPTDYNARNIVVGRVTDDVRFIELAKLGWDWPERRLVQYTVSMGSGRPDGGFRSALDRDGVARYASLAAWSDEEPGVARRRLDAHHFVFHALAGLRLRQALLDPAEESRARLLGAWRDPPRRLRELYSLLARPLSDDPVVNELRFLAEGPDPDGPRSPLPR